TAAFKSNLAEPAARIGAGAAVTTILLLASVHALSPDSILHGGVVSECANAGRRRLHGLYRRGKSCYSNRYRNIELEARVWPAAVSVSFQDISRYLFLIANRAPSSPPGRLGRQNVNNRVYVTHAHVGPIFSLQRKARLDRKSTRLNSSHVKISYAVFS